MPRVRSGHTIAENWHERVQNLQGEVGPIGKRSARQMVGLTRQHQEGGWGRVVVGAFFTSQFIIFGNIKALGVLVETITSEFDIDLWITGFVVSMSYAVQLVFAPLALPLLRMVGYRPVMLLAGVMATAGYVLAALVSSRFLEWSIFIVCFAGIGSGYFIYPFFDILATYFERYYPVAVLIGDLGFSCGTLLYGPMTQLLLDTYGWRWTMMILAGFTFHLVPCAAVAKASTTEGDKREYHSVPQAGEISANAMDASSDDRGRGDEPCCKKIREVLDFGVLTDVHFILASLASCVLSFCYVGWAVYVVPHGIKQGLSPLQSSFLPTSFAVGNIFGKLFTTFLLHKNVIGSRWIMCVGSLLASGFYFVDPFVASEAGLQIVTLAIGFAYAMCTTAKAILFLNLSTGGRLLSMYSWQGVFLGFANILSGFASGWFYNVSGSFTSTFIMFGTVQFLAAVCLVLDIYISNYKKEQKD